MATLMADVSQALCRCRPARRRVSPLCCTATALPAAPEHALRRRVAVLAPLLTWGALLGGSDASAAEESVLFAGERFRFERPAAWVAVDKAGATVLFQDKPGSSYNTLGVTVAPVKVASLTEFGSPQTVADKLVRAELEKDGTLSADVLSVRERRASSGAPLYEVEYDTEHATRGRKRVLNAVCIDKGVLYIFALQHKLAAEPDAQPAVAAIAPRLLASFDVV